MARWAVLYAAFADACCARVCCRLAALYPRMNLLCTAAFALSFFVLRVAWMTHKVRASCGGVC